MKCQFLFSVENTIINLLSARFVQRGLKAVSTKVKGLRDQIFGISRRKFKKKKSYCFLKYFRKNGLTSHMNHGSALSNKLFCFVFFKLILL